MKSLSHWGMFPCWEHGLPPMVEQDTNAWVRRALGPYPMVEQPQSWVHVDIGTPYPIVNYTLAEVLTPHEDDLKLTIVKT